MTNDPSLKVEIKEALDRSITTPLKYPSNLGSGDETKYTIFKVLQYKKQEVNKVELNSNLGYIHLPIPPELSNTDTMQYEEYSAPLLNAIMQAAGQDGLMNTVMGVAGSVAVATKSLLDSNKYTKGIAITNQIAAITGASVNPRNTNIFTSPIARQHTYSFKMIARSNLESITIRQIINKFRYHSYPDTSLDESIFIAPDLFQISFKVGQEDGDDKNSFLFHPLPAALVGMSVSYNGGGTPTFFQDTNAPVEVLLTLAFMEMELDTKAKLYDRYGLN